MIQNILSFFKEKENDLDTKKKKQKHDPSFLAAIQPQGGVSFPERYIKKGDGYEAVIHIYDYPTEATDFWLANIVNMKDIIAVTDIATEDRSKAVAEVNKSMEEQTNRLNSQQNAISHIDSSNSLQSLVDLYQQISQQGEVMKYMHVRLFVHGKTTLELEQKVKEVLEDLEGYSFRGSIFLNESEYEWKSLFLPYEEQLKLPPKREGKALSAFALAGSFPFNFSELNDPRGTFFGTTNTGGNVILDIFHKDKKRRYYNALVAGTMGAGKSTLLKKLMLDRAIRGDKVRSIDVTGEFEKLTLELDGKVIALDGSAGIINPLQVLKTSENEHQSFMNHLSKLSMTYRFLSPNALDEDVKDFEKVLRGLYESMGLVERIETTGITTLDETEYPTYSDFLRYVQEELYSDIGQREIRKNLSKGRIERLEKIELTLENIVHNYGYLFDGHSTIKNIIEEPIVSFSIRNLTQLKKEIFNAQLFSILSLLWDNMLQNGKPQLDALYDDGLAIEDIINYLIIIDESHRLININNMLAVQFLTDFEREARKYLAGLIYASQSIRDYVPDDAPSEVVGEIKKLFELTQYKFIMQQDSNSLKTMRQIFEGQLSESELGSIPQLQEGECILAINGVGNVSFKVDASDEELALFRGGL